MGELRVRSRVALPFLAGLGGMLVPIAIYLALNAGKPTAHGWGAAMSTDTAFALGALALVGGSRLPDRVRTYLLTFSVVDDLARARGHRHLLQQPRPLAPAAHRRGAARGRTAILRPGAACATARSTCSSGSPPGSPSAQSGVDPIVSGLVIGLLTCAYPAARRGPPAGHRRLPAVPRAAHRAAGGRGPRGGARRDLAERAAPGALPRVDELRHRPAVRAGQRGHQDQRVVPRARLLRRPPRSAS